MKKSAPRQPSRAPGPDRAPPPAGRGGLRRMCSIREGPPRQFPASLSGERARLIIMHADKWVNGTVLKYAFFEAERELQAVGGNGRPPEPGPEGVPALHGHRCRRAVRARGGPGRRAGPHRLRAGRRPLVVHRPRRCSSRAWTTAR